jgi:hypothetical protein
MKRIALALTLILAFLFSAVAGVLVVNVAKANPFIIFEPATPIPGTIPPIITMSSPQNNTAYASNNVYFSFNVSKPQPPVPLDTGIIIVKYTLDNDTTGLYFCDHYSSAYPPGIPEFHYSHNLTIPEGNHSLSVYALGVVLPGSLTIFGVNSSSTVFFTVDTTSPSISALSVENRTYNAPSISLNFTVDESTSWMGYSLDGQANVTVIGNTTLTELSYGSHTLTVYANDTVGNMGASFSIGFSIAEPFPTTSVAAGTVSVAVIGARSTGLLQET